MTFLLSPGFYERQLTYSFFLAEKGDVVVDHIKYRAVKEDEDIRCLPMLSYFPWTPIPIEKYVEKYDEDGYKIRVLHLKEPQAVEVLRCDFP